MQLKRVPFSYTKMYVGIIRWKNYKKISHRQNNFKIYSQNCRNRG